MGILQKLTENVTRRDLTKEGQALLNKWQKTGLLEGIQDERAKDGMALLLENQAKELLREASAMSQGDVEGFAAVAFPLVRRVFGNLIANDIVSVQPMSLPSGLIFFLDFQYTDTKRNAGAIAGESIYGGNVVGSQITGGIQLGSNADTANQIWNVEKSAYSLNNGYTSPTASAALGAAPFFCAFRSGSGGSWPTTYAFAGTVSTKQTPAAYQQLGDSLIQFDPDLTGSNIAVFSIPLASLTGINRNNLISLHTMLTGAASTGKIVRRLTRLDPISGSSNIIIVLASFASGSIDTTNPDPLFQITGALPTFTYAVNDAFAAGGAIGSVVGTTPWGLEGTNGSLTGVGTNIDIPEIDLNVSSLAVTAITKKLKAKWTPELAQDLNAYHNLDAEVELTSILSEQIALEIDQEILNDLIKGGTAGTYYWSRKPGKFVNKSTGVDITQNGAVLPDFTGTVSAWYETLIEQVNDISAQIHRKTLRGGANFIVTSPEVANILEFTAGFRGDMSSGEEKGSIGTVKVGSINKKWDVYVDPYFVRNLILVGRKGSSFLESGYVYAPYVPLQVTPTIFGVEDFVPRKGVMTRYAKQLVKGDMYGLVVVIDLLMTA